MLPDRADVTMTVPFMRAYTELLVRTCHARGAFAMGGMAALIPSRSDEEANQRAVDACARTSAARRRPASTAPGSRIPTCAVAKAEFDAVLGGRPNQIDRQRDDVAVAPAELLDVAATPGEVTEAGLATTSTSASATSRSGSPVVAPRRSTT